MIFQDGAQLSEEIRAFGAAQERNSVSPSLMLPNLRKQNAAHSIRLHSERNHDDVHSDDVSCVPARDKRGRPQSNSECATRFPLKRLVLVQTRRTAKRNSQEQLDNMHSKAFARGAVNLKELV
mmetsp:Transcript_16318/g.35406  ORF Transcript_16318/g.35406 Transcript_16318/m.35406 type:complete len:123 (-) Transcript_16318:1371-1739(-)